MTLLQRKSAREKLEYLIYLLALVKFILPFLLQNRVYEPHRDEFLYLAEARHLAWGYLEVPPLMSLLAYFTNLFGGGLFWIRVWPSLFGALTYIVVGRLILHLGGKGFALALGFLPFVCGYYMHVHYIFQPNFLEVFFWTLMAYGLMRHIQTNKPRGLYIAGIGFGLGMMSKYSVAFFFVCLMLGLLLTPERKVFRNRHFYFALLISLGIFLPNLIWQAVHGFPVIRHMKDLQSQQLGKVSQIGFLRDQLLFNLPGLFIWMAGLYWSCFSPHGKQYRFASWAIILVLAFLTIAHGKSYYGMGAYPILFGTGAVALEHWTSYRRYYLRYALVIFSVVTGVFVNMIALPLLPPKQLAAFYAERPIFRQLGFLQWEDQKDHALPQDFADMLGWEEMTERIGKVYYSLDDTQRTQAVLDCGNYGEGGAADYYGPAFHLPPAMGHAASYLLWTPEDFFNRDVFILITDDRDDIHADWIKEFHSASLVDSVTTPYAREFGSYIILLKRPSEKFRKQWRDHNESRKRETSIFH
ncbi:MAG TPA: glycosyltransferase family 39 protein [Puia sp.]|nr:glycosyltransferase family 39 protein [Puia sp.]